VLVVVPCRVSWRGRDRHPRFGDKLLRRLVQADQRTLRIVRSLVNLQHILHAGYERGVGIRRDDPLLLQMRLEKVFLPPRCWRWVVATSSCFTTLLRPPDLCFLVRLTGGSFFVPA
jgi:hypothetical protein